jgi:RpiB/LacA/LacB family sugar-phosphate isomerase
MSKKVNVLIPMAGLGQRFVDAGYKIPKQLIKINQEHLIEKSMNCLDLSQCNLIFVVRDDHIYKFNMDKILRNKFGKDIKVVVTNGLTEGSVCSCLLAREYINNNDPLIIHTLDVEFMPQFSPINFDVKGRDGLILTAKSNSPNYSYVATDDEGRVVKTAEKKVISDQACVGIYGFARGYDFCKYADMMIEQNMRTNGEFYITPLYNLLIEDGLKIDSKSVDKLHVFGTPAEFDFYRYNVCKVFGDKPVALCSDHSGYLAKEMAKTTLDTVGVPYIDFGCFVEQDCDYKDYVQEAVRSILDRTCDFGMSFCRTGQGVNMCANKYSGIRSALVYDEFSAEMAVRHNCANMFALPALLIEKNKSFPSFLQTVTEKISKNTFDGGRFQGRVMDLEK